MRKFAVAQLFLYYLENYRKTKSGLFLVDEVFDCVHCRFFVHLSACNVVSNTFIY